MPSDYPLKANIKRNVHRVQPKQLNLFHHQFQKGSTLPVSQNEIVWATKKGSVDAPPFSMPLMLRSVAVQQHALGLLFADGAIEELAALEVHLDERGPLRERALDERLRHGVLDVLLQRAAQRTRAVAAVHHRLVEDPLARVFGHRDRDGALRQVLVQLLHHQLHDLDEVRLGQRVEDDDLVETVEELGVEGALHLALHHVLDLAGDRVFHLGLETHAGALLQMARADVGGHDDDGVLEVHRVAQAVGELAVLKHLQQDVEQVRVRLFDFVKQHHGVGRALDALGQLAALFVADVSRRRADELGDGVLLHEFGHVEANERFLAAEHELCQRARDFRLADAGGAEEEERADGAVGALQAGTRTANGAGQRGDSAVLRDHSPVQLFFDAKKLLAFFFLNGSDGNAGPPRDHVFDIFAADHAGGRFIEVILLAQGAQVLALLTLLVGIEPGLLELVVRDGVFHAVHDELDPLLHFGDVFGQRGLAQLHTSTGLIHEINGLVGKKAIGQIAIGMRDRECDGLVGVADGVELLVALLDAKQNLDRVRLVGRRHFHCLEAALQRAIFLDGLAILARRGRTDALYLAARQRRLQNVGGVKRSLGRARADERMQLVNKYDGILRLHQFLHDGLEPLFELAAVFGTGDDEGKIEPKNALVRQE